jgi:23S rRNA pseudouridine1911/1915/1917 synthase
MAHFIVTAAEAGTPVLQAVRIRQKLSWSQAKRLFAERRVRIGGAPCPDPSRRLRRGQHVDIAEPKKVESIPKGPALEVRYIDDQIVVVEKPAGLTTMRHAEEAREFGARARKFLPPTLADLLSAQLGRDRNARPIPVRAVHRLDNETSGLVVFARTVEAESHLGRQFRAHAVDRRYLAVVRGQAENARIESLLGPDRGDGRRGSGAQGKLAITNVKVMERLGPYSLVECRLETGRTHQVRIHLGESGTPLCGERIYDRPLNGRPLPDSSGAPRLALHAATLGLEHPKTGKRMSWKSPLPRDLTELVARLRKRQK